MKLLIASDIHGAADWCAKVLDKIEETNPDRVMLLGDLLYHGPRNDLPADYAPKKVIAMLNGIADKVLAVRGNCEAEVDQMVLDFPCLAEYAMMIDDERQIFFAHGHIFSPENMPAIPAGGAFVYGHTHVKCNEPHPDFPSIRLFNPGSVGIPKDGSHSIGIYEDGVFSHVLL